MTCLPPDSECGSSRRSSGSYWEGDRQFRSALGSPLSFAAHLPSQPLDDAQAGAATRTIAHPPTIVGDHETALALGRTVKADRYRTAAVEGMLDAVCDELGDNQAERDGNICRDSQRPQVRGEADFRVIGAMETEQAGAQFADIGSELDPIEFPGGVNLLMDQSKRIYSH